MVRLYGGKSVALTCNVGRGSIGSLIDFKGLGDTPNKQKQYL